MPENRYRHGEHRTREGRLAQLKRGPGVFVYDGSHQDVSFKPTVLRYGKNVYKYNDDGTIALNGSGDPVYENERRAVLDSQGRPVMGGKPERLAKAIDVKVVRGVKFPKDEPIKVADPALALKLRGMDGFQEVDESAAPDAVGEKPLSAMKKAELLAFCEAEGIEAAKPEMSKSELLALADQHVKAVEEASKE